MSEEKRRSDRILLSIPLVVRGNDEKDEEFEVTARTLVLSRYGARIRIHHPLRRGQTLRITNTTAQCVADFQVVGALTPFSVDGGEYGVECVNRSDNIWGIQFPPLQAGEAAESNAVLECRNCQSRQRLSLSSIEVEVLSTSGILIKRCDRCRTTGPWSNPGRQLPLADPEPSTRDSREGASNDDEAVRERRRHGRAPLQLPLRIRDYTGGVEITQSENISKGGLSFESENKHQIGEGLMVTCPYQSGGENIEVRAYVANARAVEGSSRRVYGIRFVF